MPSYLLDKSIVRRIVEALRHVEHLSSGEREALETWRRLRSEHARLFVPVEAVHILMRFERFLEVRMFLATVEPMESARYLRRWARRLREHGFTREDAHVLALATFGTDEAGDVLGVDGLITLDQSFVNNFRNHERVLRTRLSAMTRQLPAPYRSAALPAVLRPEDLLP
jgi:hypothetical protein